MCTSAAHPSTLWRSFAARLGALARSGLPTLLLAVVVVAGRHRPTPVLAFPVSLAALDAPHPAPRDDAGPTFPGTRISTPIGTAPAGARRLASVFPTRVDGRALLLTASAGWTTARRALADPAQAVAAFASAHDTLDGTTMVLATDHPLTAITRDLTWPVPGPAPTAADSLAVEAELSQDALRAPLEAVFRRHAAHPGIVRRVTRAVIRYSRERDLSPALVAAVLLTENTTLRPAAASQVGAQGLMQVMPFHAGMRGCPSADLTNVESNICHGTGILARDLGRSATTWKALLRYNGCVKGTNTPTCHRYPATVLRRASRIRREILASATVASLPAPAITAEPWLLAVSTR